MSAENVLLEAFLYHLHLGFDVINKFHKQNITDIKTLRILTDSDFNDIGITIGDRARIRTALGDGSLINVAKYIEELQLVESSYSDLQNRSSVRAKPATKKVCANDDEKYGDYAADEIDHRTTAGKALQEQLDLQTACALADADARSARPARPRATAVPANSPRGGASSYIKVAAALAAATVPRQQMQPDESYEWIEIWDEHFIIDKKGNVFDPEDNEKIGVYDVKHKEWLSRELTSYTKDAETLAPLRAALPTDVCAPKKLAGELFLKGLERRKCLKQRNIRCTKSARAASPKRVTFESDADNLDALCKIFPDADVGIVHAALKNGITGATLFLTEMGFSKCHKSTEEYSVSTSSSSYSSSSSASSCYVPEEDVAEVEECVIDGKIYLKDDDNVIYDSNSEMPVGVYNFKGMKWTLKK